MVRHLYLEGIRTMSAPLPSAAERAAAAGAPDLSNYLSLREIASLPGYPSERTLRTLVSTGELPAVIVANTHLVAGADLHSLLKPVALATSNGGGDDA